MAASSDSFFSRHEFLLRRLHSLSGLVPVGAFMVGHLAANSTMLEGPATYQKAVYQIHSLGSLLPIVDWGLILLPILFHAFYGLFIIGGGKGNTRSYRYANNIRYTLQRATGAVAFGFIMFHVYHMHGWFHFETWLKFVEPNFGHQFAPYNASSSVHDAMAPTWVRIAYLIGIMACVFHLANGIWTMGITWGVWTTPESQRRANYLCGGVGALLVVLGLSAWVGAISIDRDKAFEVENQMYEKATEAQMIPANEHKRLKPHGEAGDNDADEEGGEGTESAKNAENADASKADRVEARAEPVTSSDNL